MRRLCLVAVLASLASAHAVAQTSGNNRISSFLKKTLAERSTELVATASRMPADQFGLKAPPDNVTFAYLTLHVADGNYLFCSFIAGVPMPQLPQLPETDPKSKLIERLKSSFDFCTQTLANLDDSHMSEQLTIGETKMARSMAVLTLASSWATHHDQQQQYLELAGAAPGAAK
jgi:hypothetical protein